MHLFLMPIDISNGRCKDLLGSDVSEWGLFGVSYFLLGCFSVKEEESFLTFMKIHFIKIYLLQREGVFGLFGDLVLP